MGQSVEFEWRVEFLVRMIEKYGDKLLPEQPVINENMIGNNDINS